MGMCVLLTLTTGGGRSDATQSATSAVQQAAQQSSQTPTTAPANVPEVNVGDQGVEAIEDLRVIPTDQQDAGTQQQTEEKQEGSGG